MNHKDPFINNARSPKGGRFTPVGGPTSSLADLHAMVRFLNPLRLEIHFANGDVLFNPTGSLDVLIDKAKEHGGDFRIIVLPPECAAFGHVNVYGKILMDERATRESASYPPRFPLPEVLEKILTSGRPITLVPDDYIHRLPEIRAAQAKTDDPAIAKAIATFAASVELYKAGEMEIDGPHSVIFTTQKITPDQIGEDTLAIISIPPPQTQDIAPTGHVIPVSHPLGINVPAHPPVPFKVSPPSLPVQPAPVVEPPPPKAKPPATKVPAAPGQTMELDF